MPRQLLLGVKMRLHLGNGLLIDMNKKYVDNNGVYFEPDNFYPMTAFDENGIIGHLIMRFTDEEKTRGNTNGVNELMTIITERMKDKEYDQIH
jgi:hypothetical protein